MGKLYKKIIINDAKKNHENMHEKVVERVKSLDLTLKAWCCDGQICAVNAESFAERIISCADLVMADGNTLLSDKTRQLRFSLCCGLIEIM
jgi:hypothetical protein